MADNSLTSERNLYQASEDKKMSSLSDSDSDEEVSMLQSLSLQVFDTFTEPATGTGFIYHDIMAEHKCEWDPGYPENPQRLIQPLQRCVELGLVKRCQRLPIRYATEDEVIWKHTQEHLEIARSTAHMTMEEHMALSEKYDAWYANKVTYEASLIAAGSTISMVEHILQDKLSNGFAMVRPPGHHAMEQEFNGYCTFNNVALAAQYALNSGIHKILIVDWDVHHGQGTQRMFYDDPRVLYFSIHRYEHGRFWPQLRESDYDYIGKGPGEGFNINVPLNKTGMTDSDYMAVFNMILFPVAYEFQPQLILISSGYDAAVGCPEFNPQLVIVSNGLDSAIGDEKGEMQVTPAMYAQMTHQLMVLAAGRVCVVLEGGYCLKSLAEGCALTLRSLLRDPCPKLPPLTEPSDSMMTTILNVVKVLRKYWNCFKPYEILDKSEVCHFADVSNMPPVLDVTFSTLENRPEKFMIMNCYPVQDEKTRVHLSDLISKLIAETSLSVAEHRCCYVFDSEMRSHRNLHDKSHPERPERISKIYNIMAEWKLLQKCLTVASRLARKSELLRIHGEDYLNDLLGSQSKGDEELKSFPNQHRYTSTYVHQKSVHCALLSCGSLLNVVEAVLRGQAQSGVAIVRPPGHHAESNKAMGFCFINNVAVAVKFAQAHFGLKRILIVDWDVHHGNATQHQFYNDPRVLYISLHRYDNGHFFPGSSEADMQYVGSGPGEGYNVNIPWSNARMGDAEYISAFTQIVMPISYQFAPELVLVSAGYDCAVGDPLGGYNVTPACFGHMTHMLMGLANGRVVLSLEGGYNLNSLSQSMATCMATLLGYPCPMLGTLAPNERAVEVIRDVLEIQKKYWTSLKGCVRIPAVRKSDDRWVVDKEHVNRVLRSRKSGGSKISDAQPNRPTSAGPMRAPHRNVFHSSSDSTVTTPSLSYTATKSTNTTETDAHTTETSLDTVPSSAQSSKDASSIQTTDPSTNETSADATSTADNSSGSASDRNTSNVITGDVNSSQKEGLTLPSIAECQSPLLSRSGEPVVAQVDVDAILKSNSEPTESSAQASVSPIIEEIISDILSLTVSNSTPGASSRDEKCINVADTVSDNVKLNETEVNQACAHERDKLINESELSHKSQSFSPSALGSLPVDPVAGTDQTLSTRSPSSSSESATPTNEQPEVHDAALNKSNHSDTPRGSGDPAGAIPKNIPLRETPELGTGEAIPRQAGHQETPQPGTDGAKPKQSVLQETLTPGTDGAKPQQSVLQQTLPHGTDGAKPKQSVLQETLPPGTDGVKPKQSVLQETPPPGTDGAKPKHNVLQETPKPVFISLIYGGEPDPEPLSIFADNPLMSSQEQVILAREKSRGKRDTLSTLSGNNDKETIPCDRAMSDPESQRSGAVGGSQDRTGDATSGSSCVGDPDSTRQTGGDSETLGACGGSSRPNTVQEFIRMQGVAEMHAVQPLAWCPHLTEVMPLPRSGFSPNAPCNTCGDVSENWVCLTCYKVECSRFVNEHMLMHRLETDHNMVLSYSDLSVWCYGCDQYVDNDVLFPMKNAAHQIKFGESLTQFH